jgi:hypothetical protein
MALPDLGSRALLVKRRVADRALDAVRLAVQRPDEEDLFDAPVVLLH